jgi:hypothetical protein
MLVYPFKLKGYCYSRYLWLLLMIQVVTQEGITKDDSAVKENAKEDQ